MKVLFRRPSQDGITSRTIVVLLEACSKVFVLVLVGPTKSCEIKIAEWLKWWSIYIYTHIEGVDHWDPPNHHFILESMFLISPSCPRSPNGIPTTPVGNWCPSERVTELFLEQTEDPTFSILAVSFGNAFILYSIFTQWFEFHKTYPPSWTSPRYHRNDLPSEGFHRS